ncbi:MAG: HlyD family efflux transporter periplasmic adaptor subunit [Candidatus Nomurabacteria bacterium]
MNNLTFTQKIKSFLLNNKIWSIVIILAIVLISYLLFFKTKTSTETKYVTAAVVKGNVVVSVSGSGQIESTDTININSNVSGNVVSVPVKVGQEVKKGQLIASMDSTDARIALETAQISLDKLKKPSTLTVLQKQNLITKTYDDAWNNISAYVVDMQTVVTGMSDLNYGYLGYRNKMVLSQSGKDKIDLSEKAYWDAKSSLDKTVALYKTLSRSSSNQELDNLLKVSLGTSKVISNSVKLFQDSYDFTTYYLKDGSSTVSMNTQKDLTTWTNSVNNYTNSILSNISSISENAQSLQDAMSPADDLDIRQSELTLETKQNAYNDYFIRAPFDGIIATLTAKVGQSASGSIGTLISKQKMVSIPLNEVDIAKIKLGQKATLTFDAVDGLTITGSVDGIDSVGTVSQGVVTYNVTISLDVDDARVKPSMSVGATIITKTAQDVVIVPNSAIKSKNGVSYVETLGTTSIPSGSLGVASLTTPTQITVETGLADDTSTEITSGLNEGDVIITKTIAGTTAKATTAPSILGSMGGGNRNVGGNAMRAATGR